MLLRWDLSPLMVRRSTLRPLDFVTALDFHRCLHNSMPKQPTKVQAGVLRGYRGYRAIRGSDVFVGTFYHWDMEYFGMSQWKQSPTTSADKGRKHWTKKHMCIVNLYLSSCIHPHPIYIHDISINSSGARRIAVIRPLHTVQNQGPECVEIDSPRNRNPGPTQRGSQRTTQLARHRHILPMEPIRHNAQGKPLATLVIELQCLARVLLRKVRVQRG